MKTIADRIIYLMENLDMKQTELAEKIGISKQSLYKYIHCKCEPRAEVVAKMAIVLNSTADYIVGLTNDPSPAKRNSELETKFKKEAELLNKFRKLSEEDKIRIEERITVMLENKKWNIILKKHIAKTRYAFCLHKI